MTTETEIWKPLPFDLVKLQLNSTPEKGDVVFYDGKKWVAINLNALIEKCLSDKNNA